MMSTNPSSINIGNKQNDGGFLSFFGLGGQKVFRKLFFSFIALKSLKKKLPQILHRLMKVQFKWSMVI